MHGSQQRRFKKVSRIADPINSDAKAPPMKPDTARLVADGSFTQALSLTSSLHRPNRFTFPPLLKACGKLREPSHGSSLHAPLLKTGFFADVYSTTALTAMYASLGRLGDALKVFAEMPYRSVASMNSVISGLAKDGQLREAMRVLRSERLGGIRPNSVTVASFLSSCRSVSSAEGLHCWAVKIGVEKDVFVSTAILSVYSRSEDAGLARNVFEEMPVKNLVSYNAYFSALLQKGLLLEVLMVFKEMMEKFSERPNHVSLVTAISACASLLCARLGGQVHGVAMKLELALNVMVGTALVDMYSKCGFCGAANDVFEELVGVRNLVTWNAIISGLMSNAQSERAQALLKKMRHEGLEPDLAIWTSMVSGFSQLRKGVSAFKYFRKMQAAKISPDLNSLTCLLSACSDLPALRSGKEIHGFATRTHVSGDIFMATTLVDFYMKSGLSSCARKIFDGFVVKPEDPAFWNAMVSGFGRSGNHEAAFEIFNQMLRQKVRPNSSTFVSLLSTCSHSGLVDKAWQFFRMVNSEFGLRPKQAHFNCMVDLLARCGRLNDARELLHESPKPSASVYASLLGACRTHLDPEFGEEMAERIIELEPKNPMPYIVLSHIYADLGRWQDAERIREKINYKMYQKLPGFSLIEAAHFQKC